ncbi:MAG: mycothiol system anti-sigma-R factor [Nocardioidaceae bacterium]
MTAGFDQGTDDGTTVVPTECAAILTDVYRFLDDECDDTRRSAIADHLDACSPCLEYVGVLHEVKELVRRKCGGEKAPDTLRKSVRTRLASVHLESGTVESARFETVQSESGRLETGQFGSGPAPTDD